jgi:hypothetical protein
MRARTAARVRTRVGHHRQAGGQHDRRAPACDRVLTVDLHADQIQGFFDIPVDNVYGSPVLLGDAWRQRIREHRSWFRPMWAAWCVPARWPSSSHDVDLAIIDKRRPRANESKVMNIIGDVEAVQLRADRRHGRYRRYAVPGGQGAEGARRAAGRRLHHPSGAVGQGGGAHRQFGARSSWWSRTPFRCTRCRAGLRTHPRS